ncbi:unnamed protein product [Triticum turgidum subsp. durum]|uniref:Lipoxygenase n=1 Tax=Triticum turgidum subsp. durum TaxID=4567 RepID=A0A9R0VAD5_TRITD|nr:unnamed protein product [Triticum turgidum subsp. durum]
MQMPFCPKLWDRSPVPPANAIAVNGTVVVANTFGLSAPGKSTTLRLFSGTQIDHETGKGKLSPEAPLRGGKKSKHGKTSTTTYHVTFLVDADFGTPGAVSVRNGNRADQFFLRHVRLELAEDRSIHFECNSWVYPYKKTASDRLFFINSSYLPSKTPEALVLLRDEELRSLRGDGKGERKDWERIYDYDRYNDLGNPDNPEHVRPVVGGTRTHPYPRRCRTGRAISNTDGVTETRKHMINLDFYIPPDERFSPGKLAEVLKLGVQAVTHFVIPEARTLIHGNDFKSMEQLRKDLYSRPVQPAVDGEVMEKLKSSVPSHKTYKQVAKAVKEEHPAKFPIPQVIQQDPEAWRSDEEFAREMLAGLNPVAIKRLQTFPPVSSGGKKSSITAEHIKSQLGDVTIEMAMHQKRLYILDHHDYLMPYLRRINTLGVCIYASRTLLFLKADGTLKPVVIELSLPSDGEGDTELSRVFLPASHGTEGHLWQLAKAHVSVNDSGYHQLISHWLFTHAAVEPFIIATRRQLSAMHPIHKLLEPHFKDTMQINTLARSILLNAGGILERTMYPGKYAVEMSSAIYGDWRFTEQSLPNDLLKRGVASSSNEPGGLTLHIEDYPYAVDGLEVWHAIDGWVRSYCAHFYHSDKEVDGDAELQAWWHDVRTVGHGDRQGDQACWLALDTVDHLAQTLSTLIWIASALHAAVNFGQYAYAGFPPNRPTRCRRFVPLPGSPEMTQLEADPEKFFLEMVPDRFTATLGLALIEVLSNHTSDEVYLGQRATSTWTDDGQLLRLLDRFREDLRRVEKRVEERNKDQRLKNRRGPAKVPYTLLFPDVAGQEKGLTGKGIPNSVSI